MTEPKKYQLQGAQLIHKFGGRALLADEMGLGKSFQSLYYASKVPSRRPIVVVCPAQLKWQWRDEAWNHLRMKSDILSGRIPKKDRVEKKAHEELVIVNYDILEHWNNWIISLKPQIIIFDEAQAVSNRTSLKYKHLHRLIQEAQIPTRIALTGTPLSNRPAELWSILHLLRPDAFASFTNFGMHYCNPKMERGKIEFTGAHNLAGLHKKLKEFVMIRRVKEDVASELPPKSRATISFEMTKAQRKEYDLCDRNFLKWIMINYPDRVHKIRAAQDREENEAKKGGIHLGYKLRLCGELKRDLTKAWIDNFLAGSEKKLIVFSQSLSTLAWFHSKYPEISVVIDGGVTGQKRHEAVQAFQRNKKIRLSFSQHKAGGVGVTMHAASNVVYHDYPWDAATLLQGEDRVHRIGQTEKCFIWYLTFADTVEKHVLSVLNRKQDILTQVLDGRKRQKHEKAKIITA